MNTYTRQDIATAAEHAANRIAPTTNTYKTYWTIQRKPGTRTGQQPTYRVSLNGFWLSTDHINAELLLDVMATGATIRDMREAINDAEMSRHRARRTPEPLPLDPEHLRPVFNPQRPTQRVTSTIAEPLTLQLQFTGTPTQVDRSRQRIAGQLALMDTTP